MHSRNRQRVAAGVLLVLGLLFTLPFPSPAEGGETVAHVKAKGTVRCGVIEDIPGFSSRQPDGRWTGMDTDFCRAVAAAVLGDAEKVDFVPLAAVDRIPALKAGEVDVLLGNTTWTFEREATLEVMFVGVLYYGGQGFVVPTRSGIREMSQLNGAPICTVKGTTHEANLMSRFGFRGWTCKPVQVESQSKAADALSSGQCQAYTAEVPHLRSLQLSAPEGPDQFTILPGLVSKEPAGPVVRRGDDEWFTIVRWVLFTLIGSEEVGISRPNLQSKLDDGTDPAVQRFSDLDRMTSHALNLPPGWAVRVMESVGNYGEVFERNLGSGSPFKLERGPNDLWTRGGLLYAPPLR